MKLKQRESQINKQIIINIEFEWCWCTFW